MNIRLNEKIKIIKVNKNVNAKIIDYLHKNGITAGKKVIRQKFTVPIIELKDYTRIWMLTEEIQYI
uniref:hypothetical protein n=1 Tax=Catenella fusiformis TaxID=3024791 RepID=UPI0027DA116E|nr:hypothetical protein REQ04_pgp076 [Catenella fusiformis]WCH57551.1 hypothetical protein [Catenella fusiformis]